MSAHDRWRRAGKLLPAAERPGGLRWEVRWREAGKQCKRRFDTRGQAEAFEAHRRLEPVTNLLNSGRMLTVDQLMDTWLQTKAGLPGLKTQDVYKTDAREVLLTFAGQLAGELSPTTIRLWVARDRGQSLRERSLRALRQAYQLAIADGLLKMDPTAKIPRPRPVRPPMRFLTWLELRRLAGEDPLLWVLGAVGLRIGEAAGLQVGDVQGKRLHVKRQVTIGSGGLLTGPPKHGRAREVPVPRFVLELLPVEGRRPEEWLFGNRSGGPLHTANWRRRVFAPAVTAAGLAPLKPHELRHTAASLLIASGADVKSVQRTLGHASAAMTLDLYAGLFDAQLDAVAEHMDAAHLAATPRLRVV